MKDFVPEKEEAGMEALPADSETGVQADEELSSVSLLAPVAGKVIPLNEVPDEVFASGVAGQGAAILPEEERICAPCAGRVSMVFPSGHALGMRTPEGLELLLHVGLNTVMLNGDGFEVLVKEGDEVKAGQELLRFDGKKIKEAGYSLISPILVTNADEVKEVLPPEKEAVKAGEEFYRVLV